MEQKLVEYLREKFNPTAIILHGSRASGHARTHSDWDFVLLYGSETVIPKNGRTEEFEENVEFTHHQLPVVDVMREFGTKLQNARVVHENENAGSEILKRSQLACTEPLAWTEEEKHSHSLWMQGRVNGMKDTIMEPALFEKYAADFYQRITNYWYWAIKDRYPKPIYLALEEITENDPGYFSLIQQYVNGDRKIRVEVAEQIQTLCFPK
jgi:hypothetical protein